MLRRHPNRRVSRTAYARPELYQLEVFLTVVEARSFAGAARLLGRTQPAVSQAIARLENLYGGNLFERGRGAPLTLTPIGEAILPAARTILHTVDQQITSAVETAQSRTGAVTLGFSVGIAAGPLRAAIREFRAANPLIRLRLVEGSRGDVFGRLTERAADLIVVEDMPTLASNVFEQEALWPDQRLIALPVGHQLTREQPPRWGELSVLPFIVRGSDADAELVRALIAGTTGKQIECERQAVSCGALLDMVGLGMGATLALASARTPRDDVVFRPLVGPDSFVQVQAIWRPGDGRPLRHRLLTAIRKQRTRSPEQPLSPTPPTTTPAPDHG